MNQGRLPAERELAGRIGDGLCSTMPDESLLAKFREAGGAGKPTQGGFKVCHASSAEAAVKTAHRLWANEQLPGREGAPRRPLLMMLDEFPALGRLDLQHHRFQPVQSGGVLAATGDRDPGRAQHVAHPAIRSRGTLVGSIAHADPAAELPALFVLLEGEARVRDGRYALCR